MSACVMVKAVMLKVSGKSLETTKDEVNVKVSVANGGNRQFK